MPKIRVTAKPSAKMEEVRREADGSYRVAVKAPPDEGRANKAVIQALHRFFKIPKRCITIVHGQKSRQKIVMIEGSFPSEPN